MVRKLLALALAVVPGSAQAAWRAATSDHFVVYTQQGEASAREAAARLEKFQIALRFLTGTKAPPSPVKISIFMVGNPTAVQATMPFGGGEGIAGYYSTQMRGPFAIMSRTDAGRSSGTKGDTANDGLGAQQILFHELTHHFTHQYYPAAYPVWYSEGFADYIGSMDIGANDAVSVGKPVNNRYRGFAMNDWLPVQRLLTARSYADVGSDVSLLYSEGWLLVHYLSNTRARPGQLRTYLAAINQGKPFAQAATDAFGDLGKLDQELHNYAGRGVLQAIVLPFKKLDPGPIAVRTLSPAEDTMLHFDMQLYAGVPQAQAGAFADRVQATASRYPDAPRALALTVEAQRLAGRAKDASTTVEHWLKVAPDDAQALAAQADVRSDLLEQAHVKDAGQWIAVRKLYAVAAKRLPDQPRILRGFYETYRRQGVMPPDSAQNALYAAFQLLPQEDDLRHEVAADFEQRGMLDEAIAVIRPTAFQSVDPAELSPRERERRKTAQAKHKIAGEDDGESAREMLDRLQAKKAGRKPT